jgi:hypothetical protein
VETEQSDWLGAFAAERGSGHLVQLNAEA